MEARPVRQSSGSQNDIPAEPAANSATPTSVSAPPGLLLSPIGQLWLTPWFLIRVVAALAGGLTLRLWMMGAFPQVSGDALIYGGLAKNLLLHHQFALTDGSGVIHPTLIRLPGYPIFLAACFQVFGMENYAAVAWLQIALELVSCLLLADFVRRISTPRAGLNTLWLATMCPFTAVFASAPLTESLTFDAICLALWSLERYLSKPSSGCPISDPGFGSDVGATKASPVLAFLSVIPEGNLLSFDPMNQSGCPTLPRRWEGGDNGCWGWLALFAIALGTAAMLRPDGAILAFALWPALLFSRGTQPLRPAIQKALLCALLAILPFAAWTVRNWSAFHVFEPLAPRYANDPGEDPHLGYQHWVKTWCLDFTCTNEIYWNVPDSPISVDDLPSQAFDSPAQHQETTDLIADYNNDPQLTPEIDARFAALARERTAAHPLRTWLWMPLGRLADMTLRPRVENLTIDLRWWEYGQHRYETEFSWGYGVVNLLFLILGIAGLCYRPRYWPYMLAYLILRSLLLMTIEAPETRYTLEFFPFLFATGGIALQRIFTPRLKRQGVPQIT
jgi:hypothetical protein